MGQNVDNPLSKVVSDLTDYMCKGKELKRKLGRNGRMTKELIT